jgi:hypothetical protein
MLKDFQSRIGADFFDRTLVAFEIDNRIVAERLADLGGRFRSGALNAKSLTFDNLVPSRGDLLRRWRVPAENTWLAKYLPKSALAS